MWQQEDPLIKTVSLCFQQVLNMRFQDLLGSFFALISLNEPTMGRSLGSLKKDQLLDDKVSEFIKHKRELFQARVHAMKR